VADRRPTSRAPRDPAYQQALRPSCFIASSRQPNLDSRSVVAYAQRVVRRGKLVTDKDWQRLAEIDPLYAVAQWPGKRDAWTIEEFRAIGESDWQDAESHWRHYTPTLGGVCVEIGCGAGRVTRPMSQTFEKTIGLDVAPAMLKLAAEEAPEAEFVQVSGTTIPLADESADAVFTTHVLQHLPGIEAVAAYLTEAHRILRPGGTMMAHTMLRSGRPSIPRAAIHKARIAVGRMQLARGSFGRHEAISYQPQEIRQTLVDAGFSDIELRCFTMRSNGGWAPFWLATR
jgi:ubiquinone/menaquinone biosynthesis C-methylase UbiE